MNKIIPTAVVALFAMTGCTETKYIHVGENWDAINNLQASESTFNVHVKKVKEQYKLGQEFSFEVKSDKSGRLWVVQVDADDELSVVFPNDYQADNDMSSNTTVKIPGKDDEWSLEASEPLGATVMVFVVTTGDLDLDDVLEDDKGMKKALRIVQDSDSWGFDKKTFDITE